jgi:hypothetical protein
MYFLILIMFTNILGFNSDSIENGWKDIKPFKTNKATVHKLLGTPKVDDNGYEIYNLPDVFVRVNYTTKPCVPNNYGRGEYKVPKNMVLDYSFGLKKKIKITDLKFKRDKYKKVRDTELPNLVHYYGIGLGVDIDSSIEDNIEYVSRFWFRPNIEQNKELKCKKIKSVIKNNG